MFSFYLLFNIQISTLSVWLCLAVKWNRVNVPYTFLSTVTQFSRNSWTRAGNNLLLLLSERPCAVCLRVSRDNAELRLVFIANNISFYLHVTYFIYSWQDKKRKFIHTPSALPLLVATSFKKMWLQYPVTNCVTFLFAF